MSALVLILAAMAPAPSSLTDLRTVKKFGELSLRAKQYDEALGYYRRCIELAPDDEDCIAAEGDVYYSSGRYGAAAAKLVAYLDRFPTGAHAGATRDRLEWTKTHQALTPEHEAALQRAWAIPSSIELGGERVSTEGATAGCERKDARQCLILAHAYQAMRRTDETRAATSSTMERANKAAIASCRAGLLDGCLFVLATDRDRFWHATQLLPSVRQHCAFAGADDTRACEVLIDLFLADPFSGFASAERHFWPRCQEGLPAACAGYGELVWRQTQQHYPRRPDPSRLAQECGAGNIASCAPAAKLAERLSGIFECKAGDMPVTCIGGVSNCDECVKLFSR